MSQSPPMHGTRIPSLGPRGEGWFLLQVVLFLAIFIACWVSKSQLSGAALVVFSVIGLVLIATGLVLAFFGIRDLDRSMSPMPRPHERAVLIQHGVYRRLRHPIYAALVVIALGASLLTVSPVALGLTAVLAVVLDLKARREEVWLRERYPDYAEYATRTRRFVPGLY